MKAENLSKYGQEASNIVSAPRPLLVIAYLPKPGWYLEQVDRYRKLPEVIHMFLVLSREEAVSINKSAGQKGFKNPVELVDTKFKVTKDPQGYDAMFLQNAFSA